MTKNYLRTLVFACFMALIWSSCSTEDATAPPSSSITVNKTSGLVGDTEFIFTVTEVNAMSIAVWPEGQENPGTAGVLVSKSAFDGGSAKVSYKYTRPGTFNAVVVTTNYSSDGKSIQKTFSSGVTITVHSDKAVISEFSADKADSTLIDDANGKIDLYLPYDPYGKSGGLNAVKATFTASDFSTVTVGGTTQTSGETANNFSSAVTYKVTAENGATKSYVVTAHTQAVETDNTFASITATAVHKTDDTQTLGVSLNNATREIVIYDTLGMTSAQFDSVMVGFELSGSFATAKIGTKDLMQDTVLNLKSSNTFVVTAQDGTSADYKTYTTDAPKLELSIGDLIPSVAGKTENFGITLNVLNGTDLSALTITAATSVNGTSSVDSMTAGGAAFTSGDDVDFSGDDPVKFVLTVTDSSIGVTYEVTYTVTVVVLP